MALSFNSGSLYGSGSLIGQQLTSGTGYTFSISASAPTNNGYLTLQGNANANSNLTSSTDVTGSLTDFSGSFTGSISESVVQSQTGFSVNLPFYTQTNQYFSGSTTITGSASGSFVYTPSSTIPANSVYIKATGGVDVDINP